MITRSLQDDSRFINAAKLLGEDENLTCLLKDVLEEFICYLYGQKELISINDARYKIFTRSKKVPDPQKLPPTQEALYTSTKGKLPVL